MYSQYVDKVVKKFEPEGFEILNSTADIYSSGFPENEYFEERDDLYDGNPLQPKNRKAIYLNSTNGITGIQSRINIISSIPLTLRRVARISRPNS